MADCFSTQKRREVMSKIGSKDTQIEIKVRLWLYHRGIRYRKNCKTIIGKPDITIKKYKIAIFVHGCFWHGHENCKYYRLPKSNLEYWKEKLEKNIKRDKENIEKLEQMGWNVFVLWECQLKSEFEPTMIELLKKINAIRNSKENQAHLLSK
ncbi:MAG: DNA mismatch endonuclease Vsr [Ruminococcaceae bacterium]|nr:DNA mismatch endonuclease Vsr [Oscillospiraceae bacterium]